MAVDAGKVIATLELDTSQFSGGVNSARSMLQTWADSTKSVQAKLQATSAMFKDIGTMASTYLTLPLVAAGTAAVKTFASFDDSMRQVRATMGLVDETNAKTAADIELLTETAKEMGAQTRYSASESASALNYLALAGYNAEQACNALPTVLRLAQAGGLDLAYASNLATNSMNALGLSMDKLPGFADQLAVTSQRSGTNVSELGEAILTVGATAKNLAGGTVELNAELGILADAGSKGAEGGTRLRNVLMSLQSPTDAGAKALKEYTQGVYDAQGNLRSLDAILGELKTSLASMTSEERMSVLDAIFNKTDLAAAQVLIEGAGERFAELTGYINESSGAAENMADVMEGGIGGSFRSLGSAVEGLAIEFGENLAPSVQGVTDFVTDLTRGFAALDEGTQSTIVTIGGIAAVVGPTMLVVSKLISMIATINPVVAGVTLGLTGLVALIAKLRSDADWAGKLDQKLNLGVDTSDLDKYKLDSIDMGEITADYTLTMKNNGQSVYDLIVQIMNDGKPEGTEEQRQMIDAVNGFIDPVFNDIEKHLTERKQNLEAMYAAGLISKSALDSQVADLEQAARDQTTSLTDAADAVNSYVATLVAANRPMTEEEISYLQSLIDKMVELATQAGIANDAVLSGYEAAYTRVQGGMAVEGDVGKAAQWIELQYKDRQNQYDALRETFLQDSEHTKEEIDAFEASYKQQSDQNAAARDAMYSSMVSGIVSDNADLTDAMTNYNAYRAALDQLYAKYDIDDNYDFSDSNENGKRAGLADSMRDYQLGLGGDYADIVRYRKQLALWGEYLGEFGELSQLGDIAKYWGANDDQEWDLTTTVGVLNAINRLNTSDVRPEMNANIHLEHQATYDEGADAAQAQAEATEANTAAVEAQTEVFQKREREDNSATAERFAPEGEEFIRPEYETEKGEAYVSREETMALTTRILEELTPPEGGYSTEEAFTPDEGMAFNWLNRFVSALETVNLPQGETAALPVQDVVDVEGVERVYSTTEELFTGMPAVVAEAATESAQTTVDVFEQAAQAAMEAQEAYIADNQTELDGSEMYIDLDKYLDIGGQLWGGVASGWNQAQSANPLTVTAPIVNASSTNYKAVSKGLAKNIKAVQFGISG